MKTAEEVTRKLVDSYAHTLSILDRGNLANDLTQALTTFAEEQVKKSEIMKLKKWEGCCELSRNEVLEEAAKITENEAHIAWGAKRDAENVKKGIAAHIRALKGK